MSFPELRKAMVDRTFATFGEDAGWTGHAEPVRIRRRVEDDDARLSLSEFRTRATIFRVRSWEVAAPVIGDIVTPAGGTFRIVEEPSLDVKGVWDCPVVAA